MKLVIQQQKKAFSQNIHEYQINSIKKQIIEKYNGIPIEPLSYEIARFRLENGVAIIYQDNRKVRTRNYWYEVRSLKLFSEMLGLKFFHSVTLPYTKNQTTEIDGLDTDSQNIMIEVKRQIITQNWIDFFEKKRKKLGMAKCYIGGKGYEKNLKIPPALSCFVINLRNSVLNKYYRKDFILPEWFSDIISDRHVRILQSNGYWMGVNRKLTKTAKHTPSSKLQQSILKYFKKNIFPVRLYYSLSRMTLPQQEYHGKGYPINKIIATFDVDSNHSQHIIDGKGYCQKCITEANEKKKLLEEKLENLGFKTISLYSGFKGFHVYCLNDTNKIIEFTNDELIELFPKLHDSQNRPLIDNVSFISKDKKFDMHRIFKLPRSIDAVTGVHITKDFKKLNFNDKITEWGN